MPKKAKEMSALEVARLREPGRYFVGGVAGLTLHVEKPPESARTWILRMTVAGKRRDMGLGGFPDVTLADARRKAREARALLDQGIDPILQRQEAQSALRAATAAAKTFDQCTEAFIEAKAAGWRNAKNRQQWTNTLKEYASPVIGPLLVRDVTLPHVMKVLEPIWTTKTETASRVRGRIEAVLDWATVRGYRSGDNPARWRGHMDKLLAAPTRVTKVKHHKALNVDAVPGFISALRQEEGLGARALELAILTAARSGEVRLATWDEFDLDAGVWVVPKERMKAHKEHRVPLSPAVLKLLRALPRVEGTTLLFPSTKNGPLSDMTLSAVMRRMGVPAVPHGFRSTFKDWASERTAYPGEMSEMALAHTISSKVEAAYRRGDLFEKRRRMMNDWAKFCATPIERGKVVPLQRRKAR
jgi:integrase